MSKKCLIPVFILLTAGLFAQETPEVRIFPQVAGYVNSASFSLNGRWILSGGNDGAVKLWDSESGALIKALYGHSGGVRSAAFSPNGRLIASGSEDKTVKIWDAEKLSGGGPGTPHPYRA
jgi:WD40 repeat protein